MPDFDQKAETQIQRITEFFSGEAGRANYDRLCQHAESKSRRYKFQCTYFTQNGEDFLQDAVSSCLTKKEDGSCVRRIPPEIPVIAALIMIIDSKIEHAYKSRSFRSRGENPESAESPDGGRVPFYDPKVPFWETENDRLTKQEREEVASRLESFIAFAKSDRVVHGMLMLIRDENLDKPANLVAERLGITEQEVFVARKRLATLAGRFIKQKGAAK